MINIYTLAMAVYVPAEEAVHRLRAAAAVFPGGACCFRVSDAYAKLKDELPDTISFVPEDRLLDGANAVLVLGGDGSILHIAREAAVRSTPILGVNFGHIGYMAELERKDIAAASRLLSGKYEIHDRMTLRVDIVNKTGEKTVSQCALNEAAVTHGNLSRIADLSLYCDGEFVACHRADGMIVASPTGSTAYSMSAGGPILDPYLECMCVTPICPQSLAARPMIFHSVSTLEIVNVSDRVPTLYLTVDGRDNFELQRGDRVRVTRSETPVKMIGFGGKRFFTTLRDKTCIGEHMVEPKVE